MIKFIKYAIRVVSILFVIVVLLIIISSIFNTSYIEWLELLWRIFLYIIGGLVGLLFVWSWE